MRSTLKIYKVIALISLTILLLVQASLLYNTVILKNKQYYFYERINIDESYKRIIHNDKLFPGGQAILDDYLYAQLPELKKLYIENPEEFNKATSTLADEIFLKLKQESNMDSVLRFIVKENHLKEKLHYALVVEKLGITFDGETTIPLFSRQESTLKLSLIDGSLSDLNLHNLASSIKVSSAEPNSYSITFLLYVDNYNRNFEVLKSSLSTFILSFISILSVIGIYLLTYKNWLKQKKLAEMRSDFINSITHEFNTPITTILVANKNLKRTVSEKEKVVLTDIIERQSLRLTALVNQVLNTTKFNKKQIKKTTLELVDFISKITQGYKLADNKKIQFQIISSDDKGMFIKADYFSLTTLLNNLIDNAIKHNFSTTKKIKITIERLDGKIQLCITDNGLGIADNSRERVFEKFYQDNNRTEATGLGLGLYYVKEIVDMHDWELKVYSTTGQSSTICIIINNSAL